MTDMPRGQYIRTDTNSKRNKLDPKVASAKRVFRTNHNGNKPNSSCYGDGDLTFEEFYAMTQLDCHYCGSPPSTLYNMYKYKKQVRQWTIDNANFVYNGLDRLDSTKPHDKANIVTCCKYCNYMKHTATYDEFINRVRLIYKHLIEP